jgi:hypothetical protein
VHFNGGALVTPEDHAIGAVELAELARHQRVWTVQNATGFGSRTVPPPHGAAPSRVASVRAVQIALFEPATQATQAGRGAQAAQATHFHD